MSARNLSEPLFHGTGSDFQPEQKVLPAVKHGGTSHWGDTGDHLGQPSRNHAFATTNEEVAWHFGETAANRLGTRNRVYRVAPNPRMKPGAHRELDEYVAPSFKTLERIDIQPGHQGTLIGNGVGPYNWNQHRDPHGPDAWLDANHPPLPEEHHEEGGATVSSFGLKAANVQRFNHQATTYEKWRDEAHPTEGQGELFAAGPRAYAWDTSRDRALTHMLNSLVRDRRTPGLALDEDRMWRESKGRRQFRNDMPRSGGGF